MTDRWRRDQPALGAVIAKLTELHARLLRVEAARRLSVLAKIRTLAEKSRG